LITTELESEVGQLFEFLTTGLDTAASALENFVTIQSQGTASTWTRENIQDLEDSICDLIQILGSRPSPLPSAVYDPVIVVGLHGAGALVDVPAYL
jgi:hypothetical protein